MQIIIEGLSYRYPGDQMVEAALQEISLTINPGEFLGIIGHTGSGKSTLVQHLNGLIKPQEGRVLIDGLPIGSPQLRLKELRQRVGLVFQLPETQLFEESIHAEVAFGPKNMGLSGEELEERVKEALEDVGLGDPSFWQRSPFELSGGQMRRVALAGVLAMRPEVLILDEPTAALDPRGRRDLLSLLRQLHQQRGITIIMVSHNMEEISQVAQRVVVLEKGRVALVGSPGEVFKESERLDQAGLRVPQITQLMHRLAQRGWSIQTEVFDLTQAADELLRAQKEVGG